MMKKHCRALFYLLLLPACLFSQEINLDHLKEGIPIRNIGPAGMSGRVTAIDVDLSNDQHIYIGTASGGVWKSESGGIRWEPIFDEAPIQAIGSIKINQKNPSEIWVGTGEGNPRNSMNTGEGIFKSIDGGKTWKNMGLEKSRVIHRIIIDKYDSNIVYAGVTGAPWGSSEDRGVYKTTDGGKTWKKVLYVNDQTGVADMVVDPTNPNKLIVAMWEFGRTPWFFNSGGKGSGMYVTFDGGENWKKITEKDGLPKGELGRIGLAIAPSMPNLVYALVEAKENGLYKSTDGGLKWSLVSKKDIGNRPFYYSEIYVDPQNENRIWNLWSYVSKSEDGGKTFKTILDYGKGVHPDHHAFWIHPDNPDYLIDGNDGGMNISRDRGENWDFIDNIPVAQFYHINYDMDIPYNVAGGMQDNGSWVGPGYVWKSGGIRNTDWQEVMFGDGFDVMINKDNPRYGWAMSQGGNVSYFDKKTGHTQFVKPYHPEGEKLRYNWNAAMAQDPFNNSGLYYGSQYVHKSGDLGQSWEIISPDLTTNDTSKQKQAISGGLTIDATNAENFTTIIVIAPSPHDKAVVWVGTDDGNLQLTKDGGKNWTNLSDRLPGFAKGSWIPQIEVSPHAKGEVFVVVNDYRRNNYQPYLYHTTDYGTTWKRLADGNSVKGHCHSVVQDLVVPDLLFLGTDYGLYFSINKGTSWQKWKGFPSVPTIDMKIHPREHDLIIGTFGRAAWIMDDIRPLREIAQTKGKVLEKEFALFEAPDAYLANFRSVDGIRFTADGDYIGSNKSRSMRIGMWVKPKAKEKKKDLSSQTEPREKGKGKDKKGKKNQKKKMEEAAKKTDDSKVETDKNEEEEEEEEGSDEIAKKKKKTGEKKVFIIVYDEKGDTIRNYSTKPDTALTKLSWGMNRNGVSFPSYRDRKPDADPPGGGRVLPGKYKLVATYGDFKDSVFVNVLADPRVDISIAQMKAQQNASFEFYAMAAKASKAFDYLKKAKKTIKLVNDQMVNAPDSTKKEIAKLGKSIQDSIMNLQNLFTDQPDQKGIQRNPNTLNSHFFAARRYIGASDGAPNQMAQFATKKAKTE
ncbi:MAG: photosystem II stability/assembly factor-like uncharacterized protein, partial [Saprospiraceae bacterium]